MMIYLSLIELLPLAMDYLGFLTANLVFFIGIVLMAGFDFFLPHHYLEERICRRHAIVDKQMLSVGVVVTIGLIIHNLPEGMAVFLSSFSDIRFGVLLALAIANHNIPEGIAVAAPIFQATQSRGKAIKYALISGMAEPLGAIIAFLLLRPYLNNNFLSYTYALVAGVMVYISFDELLPASLRHKHGHHAIAGVITGMIIVFFSLLWL